MYLFYFDSLYDEQGRLKRRKEFDSEGAYKHSLGFDPQGRPNGQEFFALVRDGKVVFDKDGLVMTDYTVEWKNGVKDGKEIHYKDRPETGGQDVDYVIEWENGQQVSR